MFDSFDPVSKAVWLQKVKADLKGKPLQGLNWQYGSIDLSPFYHPEDLPAYPPIMLPERPEQPTIATWVWVEEDTPKANAIALEALQQGANHVVWELSPGLRTLDWIQLMRDIRPEWISMGFILPETPAPGIVQGYVNWANQGKVSPEKVRCYFPAEAFQSELEEGLPGYRYIVGYPLRDQYPIDQINEYLAELLVQGNRLLKSVSDRESVLKKLVGKVAFAVSLTDNFFLNVCQIRALRLLWYRVVEAWNPAWAKLPQVEAHITSGTHTDDPHFNKIKAGALAFAAVVGGADRLLVYPSDFEGKQHPNGTSFSRRVALNVQHVLYEESHLDTVRDPGAGSYYIESLTQQLAESSWKRFQEKEQGL